MQIRIQVKKSFSEFKSECIKLTWKKLLYHLECLTRIRKGTFFLFIYLLCDYLSMCQSSTYFLSYANSFCASSVYFQKCLLKNGGMDPTIPVYYRFKPCFVCKFSDHIMFKPFSLVYTIAYNVRRSEFQMMI